MGKKTHYRISSHVVSDLCTRAEGEEWKEILYITYDTNTFEWSGTQVIWED